MKTLLDNDLVKIALEKEILIAKWKCNLIDLATAKQGIKYRLECTNYTDYPVLIDIRAVNTITKDARVFLGTEEAAEGIIAGALQIDSPIGKVLGNFFLSINKPLRPTKLFTDAVKAKDWLAKFAIKK